MSDQSPNWLRLARRIQALGQTGLHFAETDYHRDRYQKLLEIAAEMVACKSDLEQEEVLSGFTQQRTSSRHSVDIYRLLHDGGGPVFD